VGTSLAIGLVALAAALALGWRRREQLRDRELEVLTERVRELAARLDATEGDLASARSSSGVAESLLLEKGIADEDEVEATRRRLEGEAGLGVGDEAVH
jgi:hypothetical protein